MQFKQLGLAACMFATGLAAQAQTEIQWWHSMTAVNNEWVNDLARQFNESQKDYKVTPIFKGSYDESMTAAIAAFRSGNQPHILQVFEVGTATMMASRGASVPVAKVMKDAGADFNPAAYIPAVAAYYTAPDGQILSLPFNSSTTVAYYNKDAFKKAGLDPNTPPKTWADVKTDAEKLKAAGLSCGFSTGWQGWTQLENYSAWHALPFATKNNGFDGLDAKLNFNGPQQIKHIQFLADMAKEGTFTYVGRKDEVTSKFYSGDCGIAITSSGALANIAKYAKFSYGVGMMPYDANVKGAPQNAMIGGASLWVLAGKSSAEYKGVAKFLNYLASPAVAAKWHQDTGYLPVTKAAYELTEKQGFYAKNPGADVAIKQMLNKPPLPFTRGLRLGNMPQIRTVVDEELEGVWSGKQTPKAALDKAVARGDELLRRFQKQGG